MSDIATLRTAIMTALDTALPAAIRVIAVNSAEDFQARLRILGTVGVAYSGEEFEDKAKAVGSRKQNSTPIWSVFYAAAGPAPGVVSGQDVFSLLETGLAALMGLQLTLTTTKPIMRAVTTALVLENMPSGGLLYEQRYRSWRQG